MKIPLLLALVVFAIGLALPTFAQDKDTVDPQVRAQIEAVLIKFDQAFSKYDATAIGALYTQTGGELRSWLPSVVAFASGRPAIEKRFAAVFAQRPVEVTNKLVEVYAIGNDMCGIADVSAGVWKGHSVTIYVRDADTWKMHMAYVNDSALETNSVDPQVRQQIEAVFVQFQAVYNKHDAAAIAALHTQDAVEFRSWQGLASGQEVIRRRFAFDFASGPGKMVNELAEVYPIGDDICAISKTIVGAIKGHAVTIYVRDADTWKIRMAYVNHTSL